MNQVVFVALCAACGLCATIIGTLVLVATFELSIWPAVGVGIALGTVLGAANTVVAVLTLRSHSDE